MQELIIHRGPRPLHKAHVFVASVLIFAGTALLSSGSANAAGPLVLGQHRQLFIDDYVIAEMQGVQQVTNPVEKQSLNPILSPDRPWEGPSVSKPGITYYPEWGTFVMRYTANYPQYGPARKCLATSVDGINWVKPELGQVEFEGSTANNIYIPPPDVGPQGLHTPWDPNSLAQYKRLSGRHGPAEFSPNGYTDWWTPAGANTVANVASDSSVSIMYDEAQNRYIGFSKTVVVAEGHARRSVGVTVSDDFVTWTPMEGALVPDAADDALSAARIAAQPDNVMYNDGPDWHLGQFYSMHQRIPYEGMYIGLLQRFDISGWPSNYSKVVTAGGEDGLSYYELASSRDLENWNRTADRGVFLPNGAADTWEAGTIDFIQHHTTIGDEDSQLVIVGDEIWIYYGAYRTSHSTPYWQSDQPDQAARDALVAQWQQEGELDGGLSAGAAIGLAKLRLDGWVSVDAGATEGTLKTKSLILGDDNLIINALAPTGTVAVEILDSITSNPIAGFAKDDCDIFTGDAIRHTVSWNGQDDLSALANQEISIRFYLQDAKLYSFSVTADLATLLGDANHDGLVSADDFASVQANFGNHLPEPTTLGLLLVSGLNLLRRKRQKVPIAEAWPVIF